jgi:hypothetical protein
MPNMRIIPVNMADRATLTATSEALAVTNLQKPDRTAVWRATGTSASITATLSTDATIDSVALMTSNLSAAATWRIRVYDSGNSVIYDSGTILACPPDPFGTFDWGFAPLGVNAFTFGLSAYSINWQASRVLGRKVVIDISDPTNTSGYVEASRLVFGERWEPATNPDWGATLTWVEGGTQTRCEDGTLRSEAGAKWRKLSFSLGWMSPSDRSKFSEIVRQCGSKKDFVVSVFPSDSDAVKEAHYTMLAKFPPETSVLAATFARYSSSAQMEEV